MAAHPDEFHSKPDPADAAAYGRRPKASTDQERELTGFDASTDDADVGDAGNGASRNGADFSGLEPDPDGDRPVSSLEPEPGRPSDIFPDRIQTMEAEEEVVEPAQPQG